MAFGDAVPADRVTGIPAGRFASDRLPKKKACDRLIDLQSLPSNLFRQIFAVPCATLQKMESGTQLGPREITGPLGNGGTGEVRRAYNTERAPTGRNPGASGGIRSGPRTSGPA